MHLILIELSRDIREVQPLNILIPMAGRGQRFKRAGFKEPKPLIKIAEKTMIDWALQSFDKLIKPSNFFFIALADDLANGLDKRLSNYGKIIPIRDVTEGSVVTSLLGEEFINNDVPLIIANCDQYFDWDINHFISNAEGFDASVAVFESTNPHHSYIASENGKITYVREKEVISNLACGGFYFYKKGSDYVKYAKELIQNNDRTNGEFYITPVFNYLINSGLSVNYFKIDNYNKHMLGTPEEIAVFLDQLKERNK